MLDKLWPRGARLDEDERLWLGDCSAAMLAATYGTPLYVFDEAMLRGQARAYLAALKHHYPGSAQAAYAAKAYLCTALAQLWNEEGLDLDVVSGGELHVALAAGFPAERIHFHGNNKSPEELAEALAAGIGRIVVDNFHELELLSRLADATRNTQYAAHPVRIWLRLAPGIQAHTHAHIQTGHLDTKFGFTIATGDAERAVVQAMHTPGLALVGLHSHIGSQIYEAEDLAGAAARLIEFAAQMRGRYGFELRELSPGGGWGVPMVETDPAAEIEPYIATLSAAVAATCRQAGIALPHLILEPGRSLVAPAAVALYTVGARKEIPGVRTYVSVDGGMADNIRPALYGAQYTALRIANRKSQIANHLSDHSPPMERVTIAGKFCESGDILIRDIELPRLQAGDLLAIPMAGAYTLSMASNYNLARRPAVVLVNQGRARLIQRRETYADLVDRDLPLHGHTAAADDAAAIIEAHPASRSTFYKYQALGNDYIVLDPCDWPEAPSPEQVRRICDRHYGVGADGILWGPITRQVDPSNVETFDLRLFNPDGGEFEKSGNGLRIFARYLWDRSLPARPDFVINTPGGPVVAHILDAAGDRIAMEMGRISFASAAIPVAGPAREVIEEAVAVNGRAVRITAVTIGNPHCVVFVDHQTFEVSEDLEGLARTLGPELERLPLYPNRTNVQFAQVIGQHDLRIAIWERGAGYTLASGTSSCAAAGAAIRTGRCVSPVTVHMPGGAMLVEIGADWTARLTGTVAPVCRGELGGTVLRVA
jgi:diaminopimelate decarboxylase